MMWIWPIHLVKKWYGRVRAFHEAHVVIWTLHRLFEGSSDEGTSNNCSREDALMMKLLEVLTSDFTVPLAMMIVIIGT